MEITVLIFVALLVVLVLYIRHHIETALRRRGDQMKQTLAASREHFSGKGTKRTILLDKAMTQSRSIEDPFWKWYFITEAIGMHGGDRLLLMQISCGPYDEYLYILFNLTTTCKGSYTERLTMYAKNHRRTEK